jgi:hypothetical protein
MEARDAAWDKHWLAARQEREGERLRFNLAQLILGGRTEDAITRQLETQGLLPAGAADRVARETKNWRQKGQR